MKRTRPCILIVGFLAIAAVVALLVVLENRQPARTDGPLRHHVYVWQRAWNDQVKHAVHRADGRFGRIIVLAAEVDWPAGQPRAIRISVPYDFLKQHHGPIGVALRIGPFAGPFAPSGEPIDRIARLAADLVAEATDAGVPVCELQLDFDCAEARLDGYRQWLDRIRREIRPVPLIITALPAWLRHREFGLLAAAADGFVLQVHALEKPDRVDAPMSLCNPESARRAVEQAARWGIPFRVALPTYGYFVVFDDTGRFAGVQAEGPSLSWPAKARLRVLRADPTAIARLATDWIVKRPAALEGVIWYRLPNDADVLNWRWATLSAIVDGRVPAPALAAAARRPEPGLVEVELANAGDADASLPEAVTVAWSDAELLAVDALAGYQLDARNPDHVLFRLRPMTIVDWMNPGESRAIGWLRFDSDTEVRIDVSGTPR